MTAAQFYKIVLALWGEDWRPELRKMLQAHGIRCNSPQTFRNWRHGTHRIPKRVGEILKQAKQERKSV